MVAMVTKKKAGEGAIDESLADYAKEHGFQLAVWELRTLKAFQKYQEDGREGPFRRASVAAAKESGLMTDEQIGDLLARANGDTEIVLGELRAQVDKAKQRGATPASAATPARSPAAPAVDEYGLTPRQRAIASQAGLKSEAQLRQYATNLARLDRRAAPQRKIGGAK